MTGRRECGECSACCTPLGIIELKKPAFTPCTHLVHVPGDVAQGGCGIYPHRPPTCRRYLCAWRNELGDDEHRPDRYGVLFTPFDIKEGISKHMKPQALIAHEVRRGVFERRDVLEFMELIAINGWPVFLVEQSTRERAFVTAEMLADIDAYCDREGYTSRWGILVEADRDDGDTLVQGVLKRKR